MAGKRILVIESEEEFANSVTSMFSGYDVVVDVISDGKTGLQTAKQDPPDLTLLCVELPKMSGYSICNKLKKDKKLKSVPLVIMSSEATEETFEQHKKLKTRAEDYIIKPFTSDEIIEKVSSLIELTALEGQEDEELITIDDDEAISIDDEEAIVIDDMPDLEDESIDIDGDDSTVIMDSPLLEDGEELIDGSDELEAFDEVFDEIQMDGDQQIADRDVSDEEPSDSGGSDDLTDFDDVLESIKEVEADDSSPPSAEEDDVDMSDLDLSLPGDDLLADDMPEPEVTAESASADEDAIPDPDFESIPDLEPVEEMESAPTDDVAIEELAPEAELDPEPVVDLEPPPVEPAAEADEEKKEAAPDPVLATKLQNAEAECNHLKEKVAKLEQRLEEAHQAYEKRDAEAASLKRDTSKDKEFLALKTTINTKDREILDLKEEINRKEQDVLDIKEKIGERDEELERMQEVIAKRDREIKENSDKVDDLLRQKAELEEEHQTKMAEWDDKYTTDTANLEHQLQVLREEQETALQEANEKVQVAEDNLAQLQTTLDETKQRHTDEVYGLRTRYKNEIEKLGDELKQTQEELEQTKYNLEQETNEHETTKERAAAIPQLEEDLESARANITTFEEEVANLRDEVAKGEDRVVKAYQKIKNDEKIKEKARKAVEIAFTLLADQVDTEEGGEGEEMPASDHEEIQP